MATFLRLTGSAATGGVDAKFRHLAAQQAPGAPDKVPAFTPAPHAAGLQDNQRQLLGQQLQPVGDALETAEVSTGLAYGRDCTISGLLGDANRL